MKKRGILQHELVHVIATLGHTDSLVIADAGLPIPQGVQRIDLAVTAGIPRFADVTRAVLDEMQVERAILAREMRVKSPALHEELLALLGAIPVDEMSHDDFKRMTQQARAVVRTGEFTPYANVILVAGVIF
jgi:D-ribose pyranase